MALLRKSERAAYESHIETLQEQVHWLRSCLPWVVPMAGAAPPVTTSFTPPLTTAPALPDSDLWPDGAAPTSLTDEEEDVMDAYTRGDLDKEEAKMILRTLGLSDEIELG